MSVVFSGCGEEDIKNAMGNLQVDAPCYFDELCAHIFVESRQVEVLAEYLYHRLFENVALNI